MADSPVFSKGEVQSRGSYATWWRRCGIFELVPYWGVPDRISTTIL